MRLETLASGADIWPSYNKGRMAKSKLRPSQEVMTISETSASVPIQSLINHTAKRLIDLQAPVILEYVRKNKLTNIDVILTCSWGFDGSSGHSEYKQRYADKSQENISDESLFATTLNPLQLSTNSDVILWFNRTSQSSRFCRPIHLEYVKESRDVILKQKQNIDDQINRLQTFEISLEECHIRINFSLHMTLIDGKVLNIITNTRSMQTCPICHATPKQFNDLSNINSPKFLPEPNSLQYGISPLHAWIRLFECSLHISYRLTIQTWQVRGDELKIKFDQQKQKIQSMLFQKLGLSVDKPRSGGSGTSNDGNTARRAFKNINCLAECLGINQQLLYRFKIILITLSTHLPINPILFEEFCISTAKLYVSLYPWYPMTSTTHKILIHGGQIIQKSVLPVGMLGEEASEARNKDYKNFRSRHSRKHNRKVTLEDLFYRVMDSSDPIVSSLSLQSRLQQHKKHVMLPEEARKLLQIPNVGEHESTSQETEANDCNFDDNVLSEIDACLDEVELSDEEH